MIYHVAHQDEPARITSLAQGVEELRRCHFRDPTPRIFDPSQIHIQDNELWKRLTYQSQCLVAVSGHSNRHPVAAQKLFEGLSSFVRVSDQQDRARLEELARVFHHPFHHGDDRIIRQLLAEKVDGAILPGLLFQLIGPPGRQHHHCSLGVDRVNLV